MVGASDGKCHRDDTGDYFHLGPTRKKEAMVQYLGRVSVTRNW